MKSYFSRIALGLGLILCTLHQGFTQSDPAGREVPARFLPVPDTVSTQLQTLIARPFDPKFNLTPETTAEWKRRVEEAARATLSRLPKVREALGVTVDPGTMAG